MLIILGGLPGSGKTRIARELARQIGAVHIRIDSIEQAMRSSVLANRDLEDAGYRVGYAVAEDNLRAGRTVIADSVNPLPVTRDAWVDVANRAQVRFVEIEVLCSDSAEHRRRVESRVSDLPGLRLPAWQEIVSREYAAWDREHSSIDTAAASIEKSVSMVRDIINL